MDFWKDASKDLPKDPNFPPPLPATLADPAEARPIS
jgi:hypothetical protein